MPGEFDRRIEQRLVGNDAIDLDAAACGEDDLGLGVVDAGGKLLRREAAEHHRMDGADARAGQHRHHRLRHHRHVEDDAVAFDHAEILFQDAGQNLGLGLQGGVADGQLGVGDGRVVDDRRLLAAAGLDVAVDRVPAGVADAVGEPAAVDAGLGIEHGLRLLDPVDLGRRLAPEALRVALPARVDLVIAARPRACLGVHRRTPISNRHPEALGAQRRASKDERPGQCPSSFEARFARASG